MLILDLAVAALGCALQAAPWVAIWLRLSGRPFGPSREWARQLRPRPASVPPPPDPGLNRWRPWLLLWGPGWLDLKHGLATESGFWASYGHQRRAYQLYLDGRLPEAVEAAQAALAHGTRAGMWAAKILALATAELAARENAAIVSRPPFVFELPADSPAYGSLLAVAEDCRNVLEATVGFRPERVTVTLLDDERLPRDAGSRWGYLVLGRGSTRICLLHPPADGLAEASRGLVSEYVRLALHTLTQGKAPRWLVAGLGQWAVCETLGATSQPDVPPPCPGPRSPRSAAFFGRTFGFSPLDCLTASQLPPLTVIDRLLDRFGESALREFVGRLATEPEARAFLGTFGENQSRFAFALLSD